MADFRIRIVVDPSSAVIGNRAVQNELQRTTTHSNALGRSLLRTFTTIALITGITGLIRNVANFEQAMASVRAISGATTQQFIALRQEAVRLGSTTRFTATQAAEGLLFLSRAGFSAEDSLIAVEQTLLLAQSGMIELSRAADIASNVLQAFRLQIDQTARVVDVLSAVANASNTNVLQMGDALKLVAPVASGLNVHLEETAAFIALLSNNGLQATLAGTGLRAIIAELQSPTRETQQRLENLGLTTDDYRVSTVGLTGAIQNLIDANVGAGLALELFGKRGGPAFGAIIAALPFIEDMEERLKLSEGTARRLAEVMDNTLQGALFRVRSALEAINLAAFNFQISSTSTVSGALQTSLDFLADAFRAVARNIDTALIALGVFFTVLAVSKINLITAAFISLSSAIPFLALVTGITIVVAEFIRLREIVISTAATWEDAGAFVADRFVNGFIDAFSFLRGIVSDFVMFLAGVNPGSGPNYENAGTVASNQFITGFTDALVSGIASLRDLLQNLAQLITAPIVATFSAIFDNFADRYILGNIDQEEFNRRVHESVSEAYNGALENLSPLADFFTQSGTLGDLFGVDIRNLATPEQRAAFRSPEPPAVTADEFVRAPIVNPNVDPGVVGELDTGGERRARAHARALEQVNMQLVQLGLEARNVAVAGELWAQRVKAGIDETAEGADEAIRNIDRILERLQVLQTDDVVGGVLIGLETVANQVPSVAETIRDATVGAFQSMEDTLVNFVRTGKLSFSSLIDSILADLARIALQNQLIGPLANLIGAAFGATAPLGANTSGPITFPGAGTITAARGGFLEGPGTGTSDSINVRASSGEFIVNAAAARRFRPQLEAINNFQSGGVVRSGTVVNVIDMRRNQSEPVEIETRQNGDQEEIKILIQDVVDSGFTNGRFDGPLAQRFGQRPRLR